MSLLAEGHVRCGQMWSPLCTTLPQSTTTVGSPLSILSLVFGASLLTQKSDGSTALSQGVDQSQRVVNVRKLALHLVDTILERSMSQQAEGLVKTGQCQNLMPPPILMWEGWEIPRLESTTIAGIQVEILEESGAIPLIQKSDGSTALSHFAPQSR